MKITISNNTYNVLDEHRIREAGTEADLYPIGNDRILKKYNESNLSEQERKVRALCNLSSYFENSFGNNSIAYPLDIAYEELNSANQFCGFSMNFFSNCYTMEKVSFDLLANKYFKSEMTDAKAVSIIYDLFRLLDSIHYKRIVLADIKPANILINPTTFKPIIVDFDSAQVPPNFPCSAISEQYLDPKIEAQGKNANGFYTVSTDSDIYSLSVVAYEFFVGQLPFDISVEPSLTDVEAKNQNVNLLVFHKHKLNRLRAGFELQKSDGCKLALARLDTLEKNHKELYEFLCTVLVFDKRPYLAKSKRQIAKAPVKQRRFFSKEKRYDKQDPKELLELIKAYNLTF